MHRLIQRRRLTLSSDFGVNGRKLKFWLRRAVTPVYFLE
jgi:hypothetical protein